MTNVEVGVLLDGAPDEPKLDRAWSVASALWKPGGRPWWQPLAAEVPDETVPADLLRALQAAVAVDPVFPTLQSRKPNRVTEVTRSGLWAGH